MTFASPQCSNTYSVMSAVIAHLSIPTREGQSMTDGGRTEASLQGRTVVVTGAARGIGREIALAMAGAGADVAVTARSREEAQRTVGEIESLGRRGLAVALDLADRAQVAPAFEAVVEVFGGIDVLVCNSGVGGPSAPLWDVTDESWDEVVDVNVTGPFLCVRAAVPHMIAAGHGVVLVIGSMTGKRPLLHRAPYAASKLAVVGLCRTLALDLGAHGVRANVISPGLVGGERLDWVVENQAAARGLEVDEMREAMLADTPLKRFTTAGDVAATAVFLASDGAAAITGEDVNVSSGLVMY
ncbi:SDR family NAD(P)-dependent oxidoreductase [Spirillospora sp. NPDC047279]|uniref:SDR family NAD(P)-dependent oxidoreductase n=1 Tax=Spirillospora sp. NPDC047279 TaxID=3155478 RepID=UPI0033E30AA5